MAQPLPRLRMNLDFMPSPIEDRPGLLIRDSFQYSDATLIIPPMLVDCLHCFDGLKTDLDLKEALVRLTGELDVGRLQQHLVETLRRAGFLEDEICQQLKENRRKEFSAAVVREAVHAGSAYPNEPVSIRETLADYMRGPAPADGRPVVGIAAPHVSPFGGWESYRDAYSALHPERGDRTFVILGTSHYGEPDKFGLTRKNFETPLGEAVTDTGLLNRLSSQPAALLEDYCHAIEHSIEFQVVFLQYLFGPGIRILPVLCGAFARSVDEGGLPEDNDDVRRFFDALGEMAARESDRLNWVLGIDLSHMGVRYGDRFAAVADQGKMIEIAGRDKVRLDCVNRGDAKGFWELIQQNHDDLKWCGSSPVYTFLKAVPQARGTLRRYQQWNIDERSVVSFAALEFC